MPIIAAAALAGLLATPHCAAMCGGFAGACARPRAGLAAWHAGRLATYAVLGALAGAFGGIVPGPAWLPAAIAAALLTWFAAGLAGLTPPPNVRVPLLGRSGAGLIRRGGLMPRLGFGMVTGLLPCGMVYAALSLAVATGSAQAGAAAMLAFGAATVPGLSLLSVALQRVALRSLRTRRAVALLVLLLGLWSVSMRAFHVPAGHSHGAAAQEEVLQGHEH